MGTVLYVPISVTATTTGGNQVLTRALTLTCFPWYKPPAGNNTPTGVDPKLALGIKGQAGPACTNEVTAEYSPALRMDMSRILRQILDKLSFVVITGFRQKNLFLPVPHH